MCSSDLIRVSVVVSGIEVENQIVENSNDLGVTSKALVRENNQSMVNNRYTSTPSKNSTNSDNFESSIQRNVNLAPKNDKEINSSVKDTGTRFDEKLDISKIFKVRKTGENFDLENIEKTHERLKAAVNKEPDPSLYNRPSDLSTNLSQTSKSTLNSFLQKMTSFRGKKIETQSEKKIPPNLTSTNEKSVNNQDKTVNQSENSINQEDYLKEEIPAFLRRQAN